LDKVSLHPPEPPSQKASSLERWLTILVFAGSGLVYLSLILRSFAIFSIGESICLLLAPIVLWLERARIRHWWNARGKCPDCGQDLRAAKGICPGCGYRDILH
jgi:hypothetical protein